MLNAQSPTAQNTTFLSASSALPFFPQERISSLLEGSPSTISISNPGVSWAAPGNKKERQLFYPSWLEGSWMVCFV